MRKLFLIISNNGFMPSNFEPCFNRMKIDPVLMSEIQQLGGLTKNQELYIHYMIKK